MTALTAAAAATWSWDYPATATRLGRPAEALEVLMMATPKSRYLANGHNPQGPRLPCYLPANGGLLAAVALMAGGSEAPGFSAPGWSVRHEGFLPAPGPPDEAR